MTETVMAPGGVLQCPQEPLPGYGTSRGLQFATREIVAALQALAPHRELNPWFLEIVAAGTGKEFHPSDNARWTEVTRPIVEAFFHARYFLEMTCRYGRELSEPPKVLPSGWASVLYLYGLR